MKYKNEYLKQARSNEVKDWINGTLSEYFKDDRHREDVARVEHILDYLNYEAESGTTDVTTLSYNAASKRANKWVLKLAREGRDITEGPRAVKVVHTFDNGFKIVRLKSKNAFKREGALMNHCVASYADRKGIEVLSLRDPLNIPHCTIEVNKNNNGNDGIQQIKGKGNGSVHPDYAPMIIEFLKILGLECRVSEVENLGYIHVGNSINDEICEYERLMRLVYEKESVDRVLLKMPIGEETKIFIYRYKNPKLKRDVQPIIKNKSKLKRLLKDSKAL